MSTKTELYNILKLCVEDIKEEIIILRNNDKSFKNKSIYLYIYIYCR